MREVTHLKLSSFSNYFGFLILMIIIISCCPAQTIQAQVLSNLSYQITEAVDSFVAKDQAVFVELPIQNDAKIKELVFLDQGGQFNEPNASRNHPPSTKNYMRWHVIARVGVGIRANLAQGIQTREYIEHQQRLNRGAEFGLALYHFIVKEAAVGLRYQRFGAASNIENQVITLPLDSLIRFRHLHEKIAVDFYGFSGLLRSITPTSNLKIYALASLGVLRYKNRVELDEAVQTYTSWSVGFGPSLGVEYLFVTRWGINLEMGYLGGKFKTFEVDNGRTSRRVRLSPIQYELFRKFSLSLGVRYSLF